MHACQGSHPRRIVAATAVLATVFILALSGCGGEKQGGAPARGGVVIGVSLLTRTHPFYQDLEAGLREAATARGYELMVQAGEFDVAKQKDQVENFIVRKVNAIIVCPCDSKSIGTSVQAANQAGIPVFTADIAVLAEGPKIVCHVASDNVAGGRLAATALRQALGGRGRVAIIDHPEVESVIQRVRGFEEEVAREPGLEIVAKLSGHGTKDMAFRTAEDILQAHPDLDGIFGINDDSALGALDAARQLARDRVTIVGYDATPPAVDAILKGTALKADVIQYPRKIGAATVEMIRRHFAGETLPKTLPVEVGIVDRAALEK